MYGEGQTTSNIEQAYRALGLQQYGGQQSRANTADVMQTPTQLGTMKARLNEMCLTMSQLNQATDILADRIVGSYPRPGEPAANKISAAPNGAIEEVGEMIDRLEGLIRNHDNILGRFKNIA